MVLQYIPKPVRNRLSGTIVESVYKEFQIRTNEVTKAEYHTPVGSFEMLVPKGHPFLVKSGPDGEKHEPLLAQELKDNLKEDTVFYDVGARFGYHTLLLMQLGLSESQIHAFEGDKLAYSILQQNHSQAANLTKAYISDSDGELSLDQYMTNHSHPDIIKIDVEGAEVDVLRGLKRNLNSELLLFIEVHPKKIEEFDHKSDELIQLLRKHGYKLEVGDHRQKQEKLVPFSRIENPPSDNYLLKAQRV